MSGSAQSVPPAQPFVDESAPSGDLGFLVFAVVIVAVLGFVIARLTRSGLPPGSDAGDER